MPEWKQLPVEKNSTKRVEHSNHQIYVFNALSVWIENKLAQTRWEMHVSAKGYHNFIIEIHKFYICQKFKVHRHACTCFDIHHVKIYFTKAESHFQFFSIREAVSCGLGKYESIYESANFKEINQFPYQMENLIWSKIRFIFENIDLVFKIWLFNVIFQLLNQLLHFQFFSLQPFFFCIKSISIDVHCINRY